MTKELTHLKEQISLARSSGRARYPDELRDAVLAQLSRWRSAGKPRSSLAEALGLDGSTLASWEKSRAMSAPKVKAVSVIEACAPTHEPRVVAVVVLPSGARIETMTAAAAVEIARALA